MGSKAVSRQTASLAVGDRNRGPTASLTRTVGLSCAEFSTSISRSAPKVTQGIAHRRAGDPHRSIERPIQSFDHENRTSE
jgi:hypothetical protein